LETDWPDVPAVHAVRVLPLWGNVSLLENAAKSANRNLVLPGHNRRIDNRPQASNKLYMTTILADSSKPEACGRRLTSRKCSGLSRANLNLDHSDLRGARGLWRLKVEFQRFLEIC
jgi:hypothetical protein